MNTKLLFVYRIFSCISRPFIAKFLVKKLHLDLYTGEKKTEQQNHDKNLLAKANCKEKYFAKDCSSTCTTKTTVFKAK